MSSSALSDHRQTAPSRFSSACAVIAVWVPLFVLGMIVHESLHAAAVLVLGSQPVLVLRPWAFALVPFTMTGVHVQAVPALDATRQFIDNLAGPGIAALLFGLAALKAPDGALRRAAIATTLGLVLYAVIEPADVALDGRLELGFLTSPEFNYGVPLLLAAVIAAFTALRAPR
ncbi:MAG: hypothetical protein ACHQ0J_00755 [Candidatus Dormibacterales bacterium]